MRLLLAVFSCLKLDCFTLPREEGGLTIFSLFFPLCHLRHFVVTPFFVNHLPDSHPALLFFVLSTGHLVPPCSGNNDPHTKALFWMSLHFFPVPGGRAGFWFLRTTVQLFMRTRRSRFMAFDLFRLSLPFFFRSVALSPSKLLKTSSCVPPVVLSLFHVVFLFLRCLFFKKLLSCKMGSLHLVGFLIESFDF